MEIEKKVFGCGSGAWHFSKLLANQSGIQNVNYKHLSQTRQFKGKVEHG
jgi:hypothetical protein